MELKLLSASPFIFMPTSLKNQGLRLRKSSWLKFLEQNILMIALVTIPLQKNNLNRWGFIEL